MYTSFHIQNFRAFRDYEVDDLTRINLISGKNNVGKTSLLEALFMHAGGYNANIVFRTLLFRGLQRLTYSNGAAPNEMIWRSIFRDWEPSNVVSLTAIHDNGIQTSTEIRLIQDVEEIRQLGLQGRSELGAMNGTSTAADARLVMEMAYTARKGKTIQQTIKRYASLTSDGLNIDSVVQTPQTGFFLNYRNYSPSELVDQFSSLSYQSEQNLIVEALRILEPRLENIQVLTLSGEPLLWAQVAGSRIMPLNLLGEGANLLARYIGAIANAKDGIVAIDEIENGLHYSVLEAMWKAIHKAASIFNVQVFATTHSHECILAAHTAFRELGKVDDFGFIRLERTRSGNTQAVSYDDEAIEGTIALELEVR